jgi:4a-hydroxytetrahydrobiopterin dehydratase
MNMSELKQYSAEEIQQRLGDDSQWKLVDNKLYRRLVFEDFVHAFGFITQIALLAEKANHHPEWANVYRTVDIYLTTHEVSGVSDRDFELMTAIERIIA